MAVDLQDITKLETKQEAIEVYRQIQNDYELSFTKLAEAMGYSRMAPLTWEEQLPEKVRNQVIGFLTRANQGE